MRRVEKRLQKIEAAVPVPEDLEEDWRIMKAFEPAYFRHLERLGCGEIVHEAKAALATIGPRPFGHDRPDDRPVWCCLDPVVSDHWRLFGWRMKAAAFYAWGEAYGGDLAEEFRLLGDEHLEHEAGR